MFPLEVSRRMTAADLLTDAFGRIREAVHEAVNGLTPEQLDFRPDKQANSIAWLVWHLTRIQDDHIAGVAQKGQVWTVDGWADRFGLPLPPADHGYGHRSSQVAAVRVKSGELLTGYHDAVYEQTSATCGTWSMPTSPGSWTSRGTRRSPSACGW